MNLLETNHQTHQKTHKSLFLLFFFYFRTTLLHDHAASRLVKKSISVRVRKSKKNHAFGPKVTQKMKAYFCPFFRSEKLYVTRDCRPGRSNGSKRCCCATISMVILSACVAVAILIGVGILDVRGLTNSQGSSFRNPRGPQEVLTPMVDAVRQEGINGLDTRFNDPEFTNGYGKKVGFCAYNTYVAFCILPDVGGSYNTL